MVLACPVCGDRDILRRAGGVQAPSEVPSHKRWLCRTCNAEFPDPTRRASRSICPDANPLTGLARRLDEADADEVFSS